MQSSPDNDAPSPDGGAEGRGGDASPGRRCRPVRLRRPGATGYEWRLDPSERRVWVLGRHVAPATETIGGPADVSFDLAATTPGEFEVKFVLVRPWEPEGEPADVQTVRVVCE